MNDLRAMSVATEEGVAEVTLLGPGKGNALGPDFWSECPRVFHALDRDANVRAVVVRGAGEHFTFGIDLKAMAGTFGSALAGDVRSRATLLEHVGEMQRACDAVESCKKPVIAAVAGWCIGGGVDLISACDVRIAAANAKFSVRETKMAMVADMGSLQRLPRIIGQGHARELALTGRDFDAARACRIGLVNDVYPNEGELLDAARSMAREIADNPPNAVQGAKQVLNYCADKSIADGERFVAVWNAAFLASNDLMEAMSAFAAKRPPKFTGS